MLNPVGIIKAPQSELQGIGRVQTLPRRPMATASTSLNKSGRELRSLTYYGNVRSFIPDRTFQIESITLRTGDGDPGQAGQDERTVHWETVGTYLFYKNQAGYSYSETTTSYEGPAPSGDYCDPEEYYASPTYISRQVCYSYSEYTYPYIEEIPPTLGASCEAFGRRLQGNYGPGREQKIDNPGILVRPRQIFDLYIEPGASVTFSYYR